MNFIDAELAPEQELKATQIEDVLNLSESTGSAGANPSGSAISCEN